MADPQTIEERLLAVVESNGSVDWHIACSYEDEQLTQHLSIRPEYDYDDNPAEGEVTVSLLQSDGDETTETDITISTNELARLAHQALAMLGADQAAFNRAVASAPEEVEDDDDDDEVVDDGSAPEAS